MIVENLFNGATATSTSPIFRSPRNGANFPDSDKSSVLFMSKVTGTGAVSATVDVYGCSDQSGSNAAKVQSHVLNGTTSDQAAGDVAAPWPFFYAVITAISGTSAAVTLGMVG